MLAFFGTIARVYGLLLLGIWDSVLVIIGLKWQPPTGRPRWRRGTRGAISQDVLNGILARALATPPNPDMKPVIAIQRIFCQRARVSDLASGDATSVVVYDELRGSQAALGDLALSRRVDPFTIRLVRGRDDDCWRIVETDSRNQRVIILTYGSEGERAREDASRYAAEATESDIASDFGPEWHFFGERRQLPRGR